MFNHFYQQYLVLLTMAPRNTRYLIIVHCTVRVQCPVYWHLTRPVCPYHCLVLAASPINYSSGCRMPQLPQS